MRARVIGSTVQPYFLLRWQWWWQPDSKKRYEDFDRCLSGVVLQKGDVVVATAASGVDSWWWWRSVERVSEASGDGETTMLANDKVWDGSWKVWGPLGGYNVVKAYSLCMMSLGLIMTSSYGGVIPLSKAGGGDERLEEKRELGKRVERRRKESKSRGLCMHSGIGGIRHNLIGAAGGSQAGDPCGTEYPVHCRNA